MEWLLIVKSLSGVLVEGSFLQAFIKPLLCATYMLCQAPWDMQLGVIWGLCSSKIYGIPSKRIWGLEGGEQENGGKGLASSDHWLEDQYIPSLLMLENPCCREFES